MVRRSLLSLCTALLLPPGLAVAGATLPAVARPVFKIDGKVTKRGLVFFIPAPSKAGAAAVGTAHTFELEQLVQVPLGMFVLGNSHRKVAVTRGFLVPPGRPFNAPGGSLRDDYVVYALDDRPKGVRLLEPYSGPAPMPGDRVQLLGVPSGLPHDEDDVFGRIVRVTPSRIEADLDVPHDLGGWGGAPVLLADSKQVVGILQQGRGLRIGIAPMTGVLAALETPLDNGAGRRFSGFASHVATATAPPDPLDERLASRTPTRGGERRPPGPREPLIKPELTNATNVQLQIDYPAPGATIGDSVCGVFVSGRAVALQGRMRRFDVVLVIDTSRSTVEATGADINGNGVIGKPYLGRIGTIFNTGSSDPGDSILAAEVAAARQLLRGLDPRSTRVAVVTFAGEPPDMGGGFFSRSPPQPAITREPLTNRYGRIERALDQVLDEDPAGATHMAAGVDQATIELMGLRGGFSTPDAESEKIILFFTDGQPTLPYGPGFEADNIRAVLRASGRASRADIRIHSFAIGPDALDGPVATVEMATRTDGYFTPVRHPGDLVNVVEAVNFANMDEIDVRNLTNDSIAEPFRQTADGAWAGFVKMEPGKNRVLITARSSDGARAEQELEVNFESDGRDPPIPEDLVVARNWLLEECLRSIKQVRLSAEQQRADQVRKELRVEIEKERLKARERAAEQSKQLEIDVEREVEAP